MNVEVNEVYAFVANGVGGNKAGVVLDAEKLSDKQMQFVAHAVGASETAFVLPDTQATYRLRFFTPTVEVPLCGHATIATWSLMFTQGLHKAGAYTQNTQAGLIHISINDEGLIFMEQPEQELGAYLDPALVSKELGIPEHILDKQYKPQIIQQNLMVALTSKDVLNNLSLNLQKVIKFGNERGFTGLHVFVLLDNHGSLAAVRDFAPAVGIDEDAATGTANGSFLTYLKNNDYLPEQGIYKIEQGEAMGQLSNIFGKFEGSRVWVGGKAQDSIHTQIELQ